MIVRILSAGKSFKGLTTYLTHDPKAETAKRVAWTHTLNCANDHVPSAVDEMLWTSRDAELLKQEAGIRAGGRATERPVKHLSLNWAPEERPDRAHMIATAEEFLTHMKWQDHQAILVAHSDKDYSHVHLTLNMVHPETGLRLNDDFEKRRAQEWALEYERTQGKIYCEQRLNDPADRQEAPTREAWMAFKEQEHRLKKEEAAQRAEAEKADKNNPKNIRAAEWENLKTIHQVERESFFSDGRAEFSKLRQDIYQEVRAEYRDRWAHIHRLNRAGVDADQIKEIKSALIEEQRENLAFRRDRACHELREARAAIYRDLLEDQRQDRNELHGRQAEGFDTAAFLKACAARGTEKETERSTEAPAPTFAAAAQEVTQAREQTTEAVDKAPMRGGDDHAEEDRARTAGGGFGFGVFMFLGGALDRILSADATPKPRVTKEERDLFQAAAEDATRRQQQEREAEERQQRDREKARNWD